MPVMGLAQFADGILCDFVCLLSYFFAPGLFFCVLYRTTSHGRMLKSSGRPLPTLTYFKPKVDVFTVCGG